MIGANSMLKKIRKRSLSRFNEPIRKSKESADLPIYNPENNDVALRSKSAAKNNQQ